jgi:hypothetical protein
MVVRVAFCSAVRSAGPGHPGMPEHELLQDFEGAGAVFPGGVDVAADVEAVPGDVVARQALADLLLCFRGGLRAPRCCWSAARRDESRPGRQEQVATGPRTWL